MLGAMPEDRIDFYCDISQSEHISVTGYYRNFGKIIYIDFSHLLEIARPKRSEHMQRSLV